MDYTVLNRIKSPDDLKSLSEVELIRLCDELRDRLITVVSKNGGHLSSNLGIVELTVALHRVFSSPMDAIIFDVGHQCYVHKILTGRNEKFDSIRTKDGLSGFFRPDESEHDYIVTGHASSAFSAALGIARARKLRGEDGKVIVIVGDGSFTGGMVYEALNNIDEVYDNLIVILNDNTMSISKSVGSISRYLNSIRNKKRFVRIKNATKRSLHKIPTIGPKFVSFISRTKQKLRSYAGNETLFEDFGMQYFGVFDGHNLHKLIETFTAVKDCQEPILLHIKTQKGKGYTLAEDNPGAYHGVSSFVPEIETPDISTANSFSNIFGLTLCEAAREDKSICAITAAMKYATGLNHFSHEFRDRFFDVGITEEHAVTFAAGLATAGMKPVVAIYSTFLQRAYDQIIHDVMLSNLPVVFAIDRAGIVGSDGTTHQGLFDAAFLSENPEMTIFSPANYSELHEMLPRCLALNAPAAIRYPRGAEDKRLESLNDTGEPFDLFSNNSDTLVVTYGRILGEVLEAIDNKSDILKLNIIHPIDHRAVQTAKKYKRVFFVEEGIRTGGICEHFGCDLATSGYEGEYHVKALETSHVFHMSCGQAFAEYGLDANAIRAFVFGGNEKEN